MEWDISTLLQTTIPILALVGWGIKRLDRKFEAIDKKFDKIDEKLARIETRISSVDVRVARLEGAFFGKDYLAATKTGTEHLDG